jgi:hypothetical protein
MSRPERGFHPLSSVERRRDSKIEVNFGLPEYMDPDTMGVNLLGLRAMMRVGGIGHLTVVGTSGDTSTTEAPTIVGYSPDGSAFAGKAGAANIVPTHSASLGPGQEGRNLPTAATWANATVEVNLAEVQERLPRGKLRSPEAWGRELDTALRGGVASAGVQHLIFDRELGDGIDLAVPIVIGYSAATASDRVPMILGLSMLISAAERFICSPALKPNEYRWSAFRGVQLDRALFLEAMANPYAPKVVKSF